MGLVNNNRIIGAKRSVTLRFSKQNAVGHEPDPVRFPCPVLKPNLIADKRFTFFSQLLRHPSCNRDRGYSSRLGAADNPFFPTSGLKTHLRKLGRFAGTGIPGNYHNRIPGNGIDDLITVLRYGKIFRIINFIDNFHSFGVR